MPDKRFHISAESLEEMAFEHPLAYVTIDDAADVAYLHGYGLPFWADLEPVTA